MSAFWKHYARMNDDIRHELVEKGWFGRQVTGDAMSEDVASQQHTPDQEAPQKRHALYEQVWGKAAAHTDVYGHAAVPADTPTVAPPETGPEPEV